MALGKKTLKGDPVAGVFGTYVGEWGEAVGSWLQTHLTLAIVAPWGVNQWMKGLCLPSFLFAALTFKYINKSSKKQSVRAEF